MILTAIVMIIILVSIVFFYNQLAKLDVLSQNAWSNLLEKFENLHILLLRLNKNNQLILPKSLDELIDTASNAVDISSRVQKENELAKILEQFISTPITDINVKHDASIVKTDLQIARRQYNAAVRDYNVAIHTIPTCWIAKATKAKEKIFFKIE